MKPKGNDGTSSYISKGKRSLAQENSTKTLKCKRALSA